MVFYFILSVHLLYVAYSKFQDLKNHKLGKKSVKGLFFLSYFFYFDYSLCFWILPGCVVFWSSFIGVQERVLTLACQAYVHSD